MNLKKLLVALVCLALALSPAAFAEEDKDQRIAELEARVAELETENEALQVYRRQALLAEFDGGEILLATAQEQYDYYEAMYASYGMSLADLGYDAALKQDIANSLIEDALLYHKAREMGLDQPDEETRQSYEEQATASFSANVQSYAANYFSGEGVSEEEASQSAVDYLEGLGYTYDGVLESLLHNHAVSAVREEITRDVVATEEDVLSTYDEMVAAAQEAYSSSPSSYESARASGTAVAWNPEGYRQVKHILFKFDEDQAARYDELYSTLESLETELVALEESEAAQSEEEAQPEESSEPEESAAPSRSREEIEGDIDAIRLEMDALYQELMPEAEAAMGRFEAGESIDMLIEELGEDPGMTVEPALSEGYYVSEKSTSYDPAFTEGAMSIAEIGGLSEPVQGMYGIHLIYYLADVPAGPVALEEIRDDVAETAQTAKTNDAYNAALDAWKTELHLVTYLENFIG